MEPLPDSTLPQNLQKKSSYAFDVVKLATGNSIAQGLIVVASPLLTRLYTPEAFGLMTLFISITGIFRVISCLRYEFAIVLPESNEEAANLLGGSMLVVMLIAGFSALIVILGGGPLLSLFNAEQLQPFLWMMPLTIFTGGVFLALNYWNTRTKQFTRLSIAQVINSIAVIVVQLVLGLIGFVSSGSLIGAYVLGSLLGTMILGGLIWHDDGAFLYQSIRFRDILTHLKRHRNFPLYDSWAALLNNISWQLPAFLLAIFFSQTEVGYYALSFRLLKLPMSLIGVSIGQVFFQRAAEAKPRGELAAVVENNFRYLIILGLMPFFLLSIVGKELFLMVFGVNWGEAGVYAQILSIWIFFWFISSPLSTLFRVLEKQKFSLVLNIVIFISRILALGIGAAFGSARLALLLFALSGILVYGYLSVSIGIASGVSLRKIGGMFFTNVMICLPAGGLLLLLKYYTFPVWAILLVTALIVAVYYIYHGIYTFSALSHFTDIRRMVSDRFQRR